MLQTMDTNEDYKLGDSRDLIGFETAAEARALALSMVGQGARSVLLFSRQLDPALYDNLAFGEALSRLLRINPRASARLLVQQTENLASGEHRLIAVAQQLTSYVQLRLAADEACDEMQTFLVVDETGYLHRPNAAEADGVACFNNPGEARRLTRLFQGWWDQSSVLSELRRLHI